MSRRVALFAVMVATLSWGAALAAAPRGAMPRVSALTYAAGALICHQRPERSIHHAGAQYPVCARCLGLYAGAVCGVLLWAGLAGIGRAPRRVATRLSHPTLVRRLLIITAFPTLVTVVASWLGWWDAGNAARLILALPLGGAIAAALAAVATGDLR